VSRAGLAVIFGLLVAGLALYLAGARDASTVVLSAACLLLAALPVLAVVTVLVDRVYRRDWPFALASAFVVAMIVYALAAEL
jgi:hypothetical protein